MLWCFTRKFYICGVDNNNQKLTNMKQVKLQSKAELDKINEEVFGNPEDYEVIGKSSYILCVCNLVENTYTKYMIKQPKVKVFIHDDIIATMTYDEKEASVVYNTLDYYNNVMITDEKPREIPEGLVKEMERFCKNKNINLMRY